MFKWIELTTEARLNALRFINKEYGYTNDIDTIHFATMNGTTWSKDGHTCYIDGEEY